jgi:hypothetical protein
MASIDQSTHPTPTGCVMDCREHDSTSLNRDRRSYSPDLHLRDTFVPYRRHRSAEQLLLAGFDSTKSSSPDVYLAQPKSDGAPQRAFSPSQSRVMPAEAGTQVAFQQVSRDVHGSRAVGAASAAPARDGVHINRLLT